MSLRRSLADIEEGSLVIAEERDDGVLIRPAVAVPVETYTPARVAEFLLSNATDARDYRAAVRVVSRRSLNSQSSDRQNRRQR